MKWLKKLFSKPLVKPVRGEFWLVDSQTGERVSVRQLIADLKVAKAEANEALLMCKLLKERLDKLEYGRPSNEL